MSRYTNPDYQPLDDSVTDGEANPDLSDDNDYPRRPRNDFYCHPTEREILNMGDDPGFPRLAEIPQLGEHLNPIIVVQEPTPPESATVPKQTQEAEEGRLKEPSEKTSRRHQNRKSELYHELVRAAEVAAQEATPKFKANDKVKIKTNGKDNSKDRRNVEQVLKETDIATAEASDQTPHRKHCYHITHHNHYHIHHHHYHTNILPGANSPQFRRSESKHNYYAEPPPVRDLHGYVELPGSRGIHVQSTDPRALRSQAEFRDRHQFSRSRSQHCRPSTEHDKQDRGKKEHSGSDEGDEEVVRSRMAPERTKSSCRYRAYPPTAAVVNGDDGEGEEAVKIKAKAKESEDQAGHSCRHHRESLSHNDTRARTRSRARTHTHTHTHRYVDDDVSAPEPKVRRNDSQRRRSAPAPISIPIPDMEQEVKDSSGLAARRSRKHRESSSKRNHGHDHNHQRQRQRPYSSVSADSISPGDSASQVRGADQSTRSSSTTKLKLRK
ncbi:hypothetical protein F5B19DRAFT_494843 [Rostrohypoxylon terebratum]|nr:hypothetical protein F5B19DRAFT_494843 [Rostrohypoxylon terebratum]